MGDGSGRRNVPLGAYALMVINVLVYLVEITSADPAGLVTKWGMVYAQISAGRQLHTLFQSMFLNNPGSRLRLLGDMPFLYILGDNSELSRRITPMS